MEVPERAAQAAKQATRTDCPALAIPSEARGAVKSIGELPRAAQAKRFAAHHQTAAAGTCKQAQASLLRSLANAPMNCDVTPAET